MGAFGLTGILEDIAASPLANVATIIYDGEPMGNEDCPRFVFERVSTMPSMDRTYSSGPSTPLSGVDEHVLKVSCWAEDEESCERLRQALVTTLNDLAGVGTRGHTIGSGTWTSTDYGQRGALLSLEISIFVPLPRAVMPVSHTVPYADPSDSVASAARTRARIASVLQEDTGATASPNHILETGDT